MQASLQLFTASSGQPSAKVAFENNIVRHLHSTVRPEAEADLYKNVKWYGDLIVFAGIGLGWHVREILKKLPPHARCIVIDYFGECVNHAETVLFAGLANRIFFISATNLGIKENDLSAFINTIPFGPLQIIKHPASFDCFQDFYETLLDHIARQFVPPRRNHPAEAKKALVFFGDFFLEEEVRHALAAQKIEPVTFEYKKQGHGIGYEGSLLQLIQKEKPDFLLSINMKGFDGNGQTGRIASRLGVPLVVWFVDDPRPILLTGRKHLTPDMMACCWEREHIAFLRDAGFHKTEFLPLACNPSMFTGTQHAAETTKLGFVGTSMVDRFAGRIRDKFMWSDGLLPLVETCARDLIADPMLRVQGAIPIVAEKLGIPPPFTDEYNLTWLAAYIIHHASMEKRKIIVNALIPLGIETFGDPDGWKELLGDSVITHPNIDYRHELASVYHSIAVNINITSCQMPTATNQRVFDIPMAGGFVISDRQKDLVTLFRPQEIATYENVRDLQEKAGFYLDHETERRKISELARKRILGEHTYAHRMQRIISFL
jgi:spore maturation protein CgeB